MARLAQAGERQLRELLATSWDAFGDPELRRAAEPRLVELARRLHEGATVVEVRLFLSDLRGTRWPERFGRRWANRDRRVAERIVGWYHVSAGE